ncbi:hypothetical protein GCM10025771_07800 [Niveibacterium umoris]|uniref:NIPSNAP domain-containing protein n=1 Tax=Niveibacterium umoris TaxID=1193620 RepID=A0A840BM08_9RHOO|nr:hypothetical protein [Niveibacterium umoris]MBB4013673.1 hypothetical protein [Niveibacterium umoris]
MRSICTLAVCVAFSLAGASAMAQEKSYKEGPVMEQSFIKIKPGKFSDYMSFLAGPYKALMEARKKAGLITGYAVYSVAARNPGEPDLILTTTYPNWAALDRVADDEAVSAKVMGSMKQMEQGGADRGVMREVLGSQMAQELILK